MARRPNQVHEDAQDPKLQSMHEREIGDIKEMEGKQKQAHQ